MKSDGEWLKRGLGNFNNRALCYGKQKACTGVYTGHVVVRGKLGGRRMANVKGPHLRHRIAIGQKRQRGRNNDAKNDCQKNYTCQPFHSRNIIRRKKEHCQTKFLILATLSIRLFNDVTARVLPVRFSSPSDRKSLPDRLSGVANRGLQMNGIGEDIGIG